MSSNIQLCCRVCSKSDALEEGLNALCPLRLRRVAAAGAVGRRCGRCAHAGEAGADRGLRWRHTDADLRTTVNLSLRITEFDPHFWPLSQRGSAPTEPFGAVTLTLICGRIFERDQMQVHWPLANLMWTLFLPSQGT